MHKGKPRVYLLIFPGFNFKVIEVKVEYFQEDLIRECSDLRPLAMRVCTTHISYHSKRDPRLTGLTPHLDHFRDMALFDGEQHAFPYLQLASRDYQDMKLVDSG